MNRKKLIILIVSGVIFSLIVFISTILSLSNNNKESIFMDCKKKGDKAICTLKGNVSDYEVSAVSALIEVNNNSKLLKVNVDSSWEGDGEDGVLEVYTDTNKVDIFNIATFEVSLENNMENIISIVDIEFYDENYAAHKIESIFEEFN